MANWKPLYCIKEAAAFDETIHRLCQSTINRTKSNATYYGMEQADGALALAYAARVYKNSDYERIALDLIHKAVDTIDEESFFYFFGGITGTAWSINESCRALNCQEELKDFLREVDDLVLDLVTTDNWDRDYDLVMGLVGIGTYALSRWPEKKAFYILSEVERHLDKKKVSDENGITWFTPPAHVPDRDREAYPNGYFNLGLSHGIPGVVCFYSELARIDAFKIKATEILSQSVRWLRQDCLSTKGGIGNYRNFYVPGQDEAQDSRLGWCYGDLGLAYSLLKASESLSDDRLYQYAIGILEDCSQRSFDECGVHHAVVCHGTVGNGHMFNRLYQHTQNEKFRTAAKFWFEESLESKYFDSETDAILTFGQVPGSNELSIGPGHSFLVGNPGAILSFISAIHSVYPHWDYCLQLEL
jgi:lantibiotic modifying enzyme